MANECCAGKVVITLEGGYNLQGLRDSVKVVLKELAGLSETNTTELLNKADQRALEHVTKQVIDVQRRYWRGF
jgi:acetoin utilization deacetylase AcuC-like enzyme